MKRFSARNLLKWLSGTDNGQKTRSKHHSTTRYAQPTTSSVISTVETPHPALQYSTSVLPPRRMTSAPSTESRRPASVADEVANTMRNTAVMLRVEKRTSLPNKFREVSGGPAALPAVPVVGRWGSGHKRRHSGGNISKSEVYGGLGVRSSSPAPIPSLAGGELGSHIRPFTEEMQKMINRDASPVVSRDRSLSHPRSPSPHLRGKSSTNIHVHTYCTYM